MSLIILFILLYIFKKKLTNIDSKIVPMFVGFIIIYVIYLFQMWNYNQNILGWEHGIAGSDMLNFFEAASLIKDKDTYLLGWHFSSGFSGIGYRLYAYFVYIMLYLPIIISIDVNIFIMLVCQQIMVMIGVLNVFEFYSVRFENDKKRSWIIIPILLLNFCLPYTSNRLLRDNFIFFLMSYLLIVQIRVKDRFYSSVLSIVIIFLLFIIRSYTIIVSVPLYILNKNQKKSLLISILVTILLLLLPLYYHYIPLVHKGISYKGADLFEILKWILTPNYFNQLKLIINSNSNYLDINTFTYFLISIWNMFFIPISILPLFKNNRKKLDLYTLAIGIINVAIIYSVVYGGLMEPRHKVMAIINQSILSANGFKYIYSKKIILMAYISIVILVLTIPIFVF